ncbi:F420-0--gamma-glutamyl ligase [Patescibacteria group bacterium]|nr:F420-0--gamma-glutamyl ligase [Patescibacteria group bacterium]MBU4367671.1 F420-0--gamma-glutamyl ligase [Patescibacteria group bacterium]MBU4461879.1 F420-0--gamma-glutamyl ligase [Patescibacteria group bacterium]MCG2699990.1 F420-0--gamma-glutamyl ligase [Candidatus Parcubacteria bacterium]
MDINPNQGKKLIIEVDGQQWARYPVKTHFIDSEDSFENIVQKYIMPVAQKSDIIALGQKIVSIIQKRIIFKKDVKVGFWAKFLSKFAKKTPYGFSVGNPLKMQIAINMAGLPRIILAGICSMVAKLFGISGAFYRIAGHQINELDGFYGKFYPQYGDVGLLGPLDCDSLCDKLKNQFGFSFFVADVNDLGGNVLGKSQDLKGKEKLLLKILKDNPAGQADEQTPIIIIRKT